jgi:hypothetical protein
MYIFNAYSKIMFMFYLFMQTMTTGTPTRTKSYIDTHVKKDGHHPNDVVKK